MIIHERLDAAQRFVPARNLTVHGAEQHGGSSRVTRRVLCWPARTRGRFHDIAERMRTCSLLLCSVASVQLISASACANRIALASDIIVLGLFPTQA